MFVQNTIDVFNLLCIQALFVNSLRTLKLLAHKRDREYDVSIIEMT